MCRLVTLAVILGSGVFFSIASGEPLVFFLSVIPAFIYYRGVL